MDEKPLSADPSVQEQQQVHPAAQRKQGCGTSSLSCVDTEISVSPSVAVRGGMPKGYPREDLFFDGGTW